MSTGSPVAILTLRLLRTLDGRYNASSDRAIPVAESQCYVPDKTPLGEVTMTADNDTLATVAIVANEVEGQLLVNILNEHGIPAVATGGFTSQFQAEAPGAVRVLVKQGSLSMAKSVLAEREQQSSSQPAVRDTESPSGDTETARRATRRRAGRH